MEIKEKEVMIETINMSLYSLLLLGAIFMIVRFLIMEKKYQLPVVVVFYSLVTPLAGLRLWYYCYNIRIDRHTSQFKEVKYFTI